MDEIVVNSRLFRSFIASYIEKTVKKKLGFDPSLKFNDPIKVTYDETAGAYLHLNVDLMLPKEQFETLVDKAVDGVLN